MWLKSKKKNNNKIQIDNLKNKHMYSLTNIFKLLRSQSLGLHWRNALCGELENYKVYIYWRYYRVSQLTDKPPNVDIC